MKGRLELRSRQHVLYSIRYTLGTYIRYIRSTIQKGRVTLGLVSKVRYLLYKYYKYYKYLLCAWLVGWLAGGRLPLWPLGIGRSYSVLCNGKGRQPKLKVRSKVR
jgi:hypothetical protein